MKTQEEIIARIEQIKARDFFGFETSDLVSYLDYKHASPFMKEGTTESEWGIAPKPPSEEIVGYLPFAWGKANNCRGLSAGRSVSHMSAWLWLDGKEALADNLHEIYEWYGKPCLAVISQEYGFDWQAHDDGEWKNGAGASFISAKEALQQKGLTYIVVRN